MGRNLPVECGECGGWFGGDESFGPDTCECVAVDRIGELEARIQRLEKQVSRLARTSSMAFDAVYSQGSGR